MSEIESVLLYERMCVCNDGRNVRMSVCRIQSTCQEAKPQDCVVFFHEVGHSKRKTRLVVGFCCATI